MPRSYWERIDKVARPGNRSRFIARAVLRLLKKVEAAKRQEETEQ